MVVTALSTNGRAIAYMFGLSSTLAVTHNLVNYKLVQHTSAVSATVIGEVKTIALIVLSAFLLGTRPLATHRLSCRPALHAAGCDPPARLPRHRPAQRTARSSPPLHVAAPGGSRRSVVHLEPRPRAAVRN